MPAIGRVAVNLSNGKSSHLVVTRTEVFPPVAANPRLPAVGDIYGASCKDETRVPTIYFNPNTVISQGDPNRLAIRIVSAAPRGAAAITDGHLTVTLLIFTGDQIPPDTIDVGDIPVDYILDPNAP